MQKIISKLLPNNSAIKSFKKFLIRRDDWTIHTFFVRIKNWLNYDIDCKINDFNVLVTITDHPFIVIFCKQPFLCEYEWSQYDSCQIRTVANVESEACPCERIGRINTTTALCISSLVWNLWPHFRRGEPKSDQKWWGSQQKSHQQKWKKVTSTVKEKEGGE